MREEQNDRDRVTRRGGTRLFGNRAKQNEDPGRERIHAFDTDERADARDDRRRDDRDSRRYDDRDRRDDRGYDDRDSRRYDDRDRRDDRGYDDRDSRRYDDRDRRDDRRYDDRDSRRYDSRDRRDDRGYDDRGDRRYDDRDRRNERRDDREAPRREERPRQSGNGARRSNRRSGGDSTSFLHQVVPYILFWVSLFAAVSFILRDICGLDSTAGAFGNALANFLCGLFGIAAYLVPVFGVVIALRWRRFVKEGILAKKLFLSISFILLLSGIIHVFQDGKEGIIMKVLAPNALYANGMDRAGGGFFGGFVGEWMGFCLHLPGTCILAIPLLIIVGIYLVGLTPVGLYQRIAYKVNAASTKNRERRAAKAGALTGTEQPEQVTVGEAGENAEKPAVPGWREPRPLAKPKTAYDFHEDEPDVIIPGRKEEQEEREAARRERVRQAADFAATPTPEQPQQQPQNDVVDIPDDEPETEEPAADAAAILRQAGQTDDRSADLENLLNSVLQDTGAAQRPAEQAPVTAPHAPEKEEKEPLSGNYYAPFALPVRPEPKRGKPAEDDTRIVIQPRGEQTAEEAQPAREEPAASQATEAPANDEPQTPEEEETLGSRREDEWRYQHAAPRREEAVRPATGAAAYRWEAPAENAQEPAPQQARPAYEAPAPRDERPAYEQPAYQAVEPQTTPRQTPPDEQPTPAGGSYAFAKEEEPAPQQNEWEQRPAAPAQQQNEWEQRPAAPAQQQSEWEQKPAAPAQQQNEWEQRPAAPAQQQNEWEQRPAAPAQQQNEWEQRPAAPVQQQNEWEQKPAAPAQQQNEWEQRPAARRENDWVDNTDRAASAVTASDGFGRPVREQREPRPSDPFGRRSTNPFARPADPAAYGVTARETRPVIDDWQKPKTAPVASSAAPVQPAEPAAPPRPFDLPSVDLLREDTSVKETDHTQEIEEKIAILKETLASFNIAVRDEVTCSRGPTITRYELRPEQGVSVRSVINRIDDIALNLAAAVRIEAPIPGKPAIGIEVPNAQRETVYMRTMLESEAFRNSKKLLEVPLGVAVGGEVAMCNIASMPHLLVAGTTGSGKSVCINTMLVSLLYKTTPADLRLILIDPKQVEFSPYEHIPHLYLPIVTDMKRAVGVMACAAAEMDRRYSLIKDVGARDIDGYNEAVKNDPEREHLPRMIIIIDEFADLKMSATNNDVETFTCRIAAKARSAGIHLIIGTQRPSVNVITGALKANIPSRIAFTVMQQVDSRTILDMNGAETLTGRGDMLYMPIGCSKPLRVQGAFVDDSEIARVVNYVKSHNDPVQYNRGFMEQLEAEVARAEKVDRADVDDFDDDEGGEDGEDSKFIEAVRLAVETDKVATSLLQRRLGVGYGRAAKIIDRMEELGLVSAPEGNKARKVLPAAQGYLNHVAVGDEPDDGMDGFDDYH